MLEDGADATEYQAGIPQVLRLMNVRQTPARIFDSLGQCRAD